MSATGKQTQHATYTPACALSAKFGDGIDRFAVAISLTVVCEFVKIAALKRKAKD